jgi:hypothetical protein
MNNILYNSYIYFTKIKINNNKNNLELEKYNIIGIFDNSLNIWYNGWAIYDIKNKDVYKKSKELLLYGINIERDLNGKLNIEKAIIKSILVNSKFYINDKDIQIKIIISLIAYLIKAKTYMILNVGSLEMYIMFL